MSQQSQGATGTPATVGRETIIEGLAYVGAAVAVAATFSALDQAENFSDAGTLIVLLVVAAVLVGAGLWIGEGSPDVLQRTRSVFWFVATAIWGSAVGFLVDQILDVSGRPGALLSAALIAAFALALWIMLRRSLQQIALFSGALGLVVAITFPQPAFFGIPDLTATALLIWVLGVVWVFFGTQGLMEPRRTALVLGSIAAIAGPLLFTRTRIAGEILSLASAGVLLVVGERTAVVAVQGLSIVGILFVSGLVVGEHLGDSSGGTVGALIVGLALLAAALLSARGSGPVTPGMPGQEPPGEAPPSSWG